MALEMSLLFRYRLAIARLGERDLFHWWESSALTDEGRYGLGRLFRQTSKWAAIQLAMEAARARHETLVPPGARITLFNLGWAIEEPLDAWISRSRMENGAQLLDVPEVPETVRSSVQQSFAFLDIPLVDIKPRSVGDRTIDLGQIDSDQLQQDISGVVGTLVTAYTRSDRQRLLAPYLTLC